MKGLNATRSTKMPTVGMIPYLWRKVVMSLKQFSSAMFSWTFYGDFKLHVISRSSHRPKTAGGKVLVLAFSISSPKKSLEKKKNKQIKGHVIRAAVENLEMPSLGGPDGLCFSIGAQALLPLSDPRGGASFSKSSRAYRAKEAGSPAESGLVLLMHMPPELQKVKCVNRKRP